MKKSYLKRTLMLVMGVVMGWSMVSATEYCKEPIIMEKGDIVLYSCIQTSSNTYQIKIESDSEITKGAVNFYANPGNMDLGNKFELVEPNILVVDFESDVSPTVYVSRLCVTINGNFYAYDWPTDIEWSTTCGDDPGPSDEESPTNFSVTTGKITYRSIELLLSAEDNSGRVNFVISREGANDIKVNNVTSGDVRSYIVSGLEEDTEYTFSVVAIDAAGNEAENNPVEVTAKTIINQNTECMGESTEAEAGTFTEGYTYSFTTVGTDVMVEFELLDVVVGLVGYIRIYEPSFQEIPVGSNNKFTYTFTDQVPGSIFKMNCKFDYAGGGLLITKVLEYTVGNDCSGVASLKLASTSGNELTFVGTWDEVQFLAILDDESIDLSTITSLDLTAVSGVDAKPAGLNSNCLVYVAETVNIAENNIVKVGNTLNSAVRIVLSDNVPFNNTKEFTTSDAIFLREGITEGHFSTLYLPFITAKPAGMTAYTFTEVAGTSVRFTEVEGETLAANTAYLFKIDDIALELSTTNEVTIEVTPSPAVEMNSFVGTFAEIIPTGDYYGYSSNEFVKGNEVKVLPFRAYLQGDPNSAAGAPPRYSINVEGGATSLDVNLGGDLVIVSLIGGFEVIAAQAQQADVYSVDGRLVRSISLSEGVNSVKGLSQGIYLMNNQKVVVK